MMKNRFRALCALLMLLSVLLIPLSALCEDTAVEEAEEELPEITLVSQPGGPDCQAVPTGWETYFRPETCKTDNDRCYQRLHWIYDGKHNTVFEYLLWNSEWVNRETQPQFTAYFRNGIVNGIGLINGNTLSPQEYKINARVRLLKAVVFCTSGAYTHIFEVPDVCCQDYQAFDFGEEYTGVRRVEVHITGTYDGDENVYNICIGDFCFY